MKKLLTTLLVGLVFLPFMAKSVSAKIAEVESAKNAIEYTLATDQQTGEFWNSFSLDQVAVNIGWMAAGGKPYIDPETGEIKETGGLVGDTSQAIAWMFNNPAATTERYVADVLDSAGFKIASPAYAQGLGFAALDPILSTWKTFRNIAYLLFVVVFMVIGFLIMMRQKVGGQTVITAQQAIPQIIITLVLVTFSYAIAGLLIDMMYLVMYLLLALFRRSEADFLNKNFLELGVTMVVGGFTSAFDAVQNFSTEATRTLGQFGKEALKFFGGLALAVVVSLAIALKVFELFFELLKTYVTIILSIAFSPIILAMGALPGKNTFKQWITDLVGNLAAFPVVMLVLIIFDELTGGISGNTVGIESGGFQPPYLFGSGTGGSLSFIIGVGMLMIMPEIVKQAKTAIGVKEGVFSQLTRDIGDSMKKGWTGGEVVPGMAITDTSKWAGGGLSGENLVRKAAIATGAGISGVVAGGGGAIAGKATDAKGGAVRYGLKAGGVVGRKIADFTGDKELSTEAIKKRAEAKEKKKNEK